jgi:hypothetical protein
MRSCRRCGRLFEPAKPYYYWCSMPCRKADYLKGGEAQAYTAADVGRAFDRGFDRGYAAGLAEGQRRVRAARVAPAMLPLDTWKKLAVLIHPDRWQQEPGLLSMSHEAMIWLNAHKPEG